MKKQPTTKGRNLDQTDKGLGFDGLTAGGQGNKQQQIRNQHAGVQDPNKTFNMGRGPTVGNASPGDVGPKRPMAASVPAVPKQGSVRDSINRGPQVRNPSGTRPWDPKAGQNYKGNADAINVGRGPTKGTSQ
jgi:hypothetical protein